MADSSRSHIYLFPYLGKLFREWRWSSLHRSLCRFQRMLCSVRKSLYRSILRNRGNKLVQLDLIVSPSVSLRFWGNSVFLVCILNLSSLDSERPISLLCNSVWELCRCWRIEVSRSRCCSRDNLGSTSSCGWNLALRNHSRCRRSCFHHWWGWISRQDCSQSSLWRKPNPSLGDQAVYILICLSHSLLSKLTNPFSSNQAHNQTQILQSPFHSPS